MSVIHNMNEHDVERIFLLNLDRVLKDFEVMNQDDDHLSDEESDLRLVVQDLVKKFKVDVENSSSFYMIQTYLDETLVKKLLSDGFSISVDDESSCNCQKCNTLRSLQESKKK